ncbi:MAG: helix-turn-helix domain-containing protein [Acidimicrobiales bacterium]
MEWLDASTENCPVGLSLELLGEKWTLLIVRDALNGVRRFDVFRRHMGLSEAVLADRLAKLVAAGVLELRPYRDEGRRARNEYRLTPAGRDLLPVILALKEWGETHLGDPDEPVIRVRHRDCGGEARLTLRCAEHPDEPLTARDTEVSVGPGARAAVGA